MSRYSPVVEVMPRFGGVRMAELFAAPPAITFFSVIFVAIMLAAAAYDLASYTIPNFLSVALVAVFVGFALWSDLAWSDIGAQVATAFGMLVVGWVLFAFGLIGGGDAKLLAATSLWYAWPSIADYFVAFSLAGGVLAIMAIWFRRLNLPERLAAIGWIRQLHDPQKGLPYGVALAFGALAVAPPPLDSVVYLLGG